MADIPLKPEDEMTNDLVGAVENIAQSVKAGSRDFTKSFTGLTTAIKRLQTTLVNAIKAIKIQVVAKPEKVQKPATKDKATSTKEVVKEKETKTEVAPEKKAKTPKVEAAKKDVPEIKVPKIETPEVKQPESKAAKDPVVTKQPKPPKVVNPIEAAEKENTKKQKQEDAGLRSQKLRDQAKIIALRLEEALKPKPVKEAKPPKEPKAAKEPKKTIDPQEKERVTKEKSREKEIQKRQEKVKPVKISSLIEGIDQTGDAWSKMISGVRQSIIENEKIVKAEEKQVEKTGKEGTKEFVGPSKKLFEKDEKANSDASNKAIADAKKAQDKKDAADAKKDADEVAKVANDLVKQQEQAARNLEQANQKTQKELDGLIGAFQRLTPLFKGPLVNFGLKMIAKGVGYKQPKEMSKGGDVSYLADGGDASSQMKPKGTDTQPAMLTPGEFVVNKDAAKDPENKKQLKSINSGKNKKNVEYHSSGGLAGYYSSGGEETRYDDEKSKKEIELENKKSKEELNSLVSGFQKLSPLFKGPLVKYGLNMIAKGIGYKQPKEMSKGGDVSYLADGGTAMKPKGTDTQPAMLTPGEFVVNKGASQDPENRKQLESINSGKGKKKVEYHSSGGSVGGVGYYAAGGVVGAALGAAVTISGVVINSFTSSVKLASDAIATFGSFVAKANPAVMQKLEIIFNDLQGVIGRSVAPAFIYLTPLLRKFADYVDYGMKLIGPSISKTAVAFGNIVSPLLDLGSVLIEILSPAISFMSSAFLGVTEVVKPIIQFFATLIGAINDIVSVLIGWIPIADFVGGTLTAFGFVVKTVLEMVLTAASLFVTAVGAIIKGIGYLISKIPFMGSVGKGIMGTGDKLLKTGSDMRDNNPNRIKSGSSTGAAVREVQSMSISSVGDEIRKNAMMAASGQKSQEDMLSDISGKLDKEQLAAAFAAGLQKNPQNPAAPLVGSNPFFRGLPSPTGFGPTI